MFHFYVGYIEMFIDKIHDSAYTSKKKVIL